MKKMIYFDMDGTIADLYGVENWLDMLRADNVLPYIKAAPMADMAEMSYLCQKLQQKGYGIGVISWLAMNAKKEYKRATTKAKRDWLKRHFPIEFDEMHFVQYGTPKHQIAKDKNGIIFDDSAEVRAKWEKNGFAINPEELNINDCLRGLLNAA